MLLSNRPLSFRLQVGRVHKYQVGIGVHTQSDIATEIPVFYRITIAKVHDVNSIEVDYEPLACYVFDRGRFDLARLFAIEQAGAFFIIREKFYPDYDIF